MVDLTWSDPVLAGAIAVQEAWQSGYVGRLLASAEVLAAAWNNDFGIPEPTMSATDAVRRAVENANPSKALGNASRPLTYETREALIDLLQAQASFHLRAGGLERRGLRRTPPA